MTVRRIMRVCLMSVVSAWLVVFGLPLLRAAEQSTPPRAGSDVGQEDPWAAIVRDMRRSEDNLRKGDVSEATQRIQQQVIDQLDRMLQSMRQGSSDASRQATASQQKSSQSAQERIAASQPETGDSNNGKPSSRAGTAPSELREPEGIMEFHRRLMVEVWGQLPAQVQQRIQSPLHEKFLPQYESLIMDYYRRLAEESRR